jgi:hypothetical protein
MPNEEQQRPPVSSRGEQQPCIDSLTEWEQPFHTFDSMGLHENLLRGIYAYGEACELRKCTSGLAVGVHTCAILTGLQCEPLHSLVHLMLSLALLNPSCCPPQALRSLPWCSRGASPFTYFCHKASYVGPAFLPLPRRILWCSLCCVPLLDPHAAPAGLENPSVVQQKGLVPFTRGLDVILQAVPRCICCWPLQLLVRLLSSLAFLAPSRAPSSRPPQALPIPP